MKQLTRGFLFAVLFSMALMCTACGNMRDNGDDTDLKTEEARESEKPSPSPDRSADPTEDVKNTEDADGAVGDMVDDVGTGVEEGVNDVVDGVENAGDALTDNGSDMVNSATSTSGPTEQAGN